MPAVSDAILAWLDTLDVEVLETQADRWAQRGVEIAEEEWPSTDHPENTSARDRSVKLWSWFRSGRGQRTIINGASYSGHTNDGSTRYGGANSARPWHARGGEDYTEQIAQRLIDEMQGEMARDIERG